MAIVGIDLGTSNSLVAVWSENNSKLITNALGETLTPSAISIADDGMVLVGRAAADTRPNPRGQRRWRFGVSKETISRACPSFLFRIAEVHSCNGSMRDLALLGS
jgi:hypothetical protein